MKILAGIIIWVGLGYLLHNVEGIAMGYVISAAVGVVVAGAGAFRHQPADTT